MNLGDAFAYPMAAGSNKEQSFDPAIAETANLVGVAVLAMLSAKNYAL
ncbi:MULTISPECIES: hypothetical protein [unclassified Ensifer]|nr:MULTISPECIES: hypothetical protein [unclassified Ensifer]